MMLTDSTKTSLFFNTIPNHNEPFVPRWHESKIILCEWNGAHRKFTKCLFVFPITVDSATSEVLFQFPRIIFSTRVAFILVCDVLGWPARSSTCMSVRQFWNLLPLSVTLHSPYTTTVHLYQPAVNFDGRKRFAHKVQTPLRTLFGTMFCYVTATALQITPWGASDGLPRFFL